MTYQLIYAHLQKSGLIPPRVQTELRIEPLSGGSNHVFRVDYKDRQYVVKVPKAQTLALINRDHEYHASQITAAAGINIPFCYFDPDSGINIAPYQPHSQTLTPAMLQQQQYWQSVARLLQKLHQLPQKFLGNVDIFSVLDFYKQQAALKLPPDLTELLKWDDLLKAFRDEFSAMIIPSCPCHGDPILTNFLLTENQRIYLIDWEYAGNNDPCWDLASLAVEAEFDSQQENQFLNFYFGEPVSSTDFRRFQVYKILSNYLWALWCVVMSDLDNARRRLQRCKNSLFNI